MDIRTVIATIEKRGTENGKNTFRARIRLKGARDETASFSRLTDAKKWAQSTESAIREGRYFKTSASRRHTLGEAIDRYVCEIFPRKPRTASTQKIQLAWWRQRLGHLFLADVSASAIADARAELLSEPGGKGRRRGAATVNRYMAALSHVLSVAVGEWEWLETSPARKLKMLKEPRGRDRFLSEEECARLLAACRQSTNRDLYPVVVLALSTGMRRNEILSLRQEQLDLPRGMIYLYDTKNGDRRGVPLAGVALELMRERLAASADTTGLIFAGTGSDDRGLARSISCRIFLHLAVSHHRSLAATCLQSIAYDFGQNRASGIFGITSGGNA
jgi:integrase